MGKLLCDSTTAVAESFPTTSPAVNWRDQNSSSVIDANGALDLLDQTTATATAVVPTAWDDVLGLEDQQRRQLQRLHAKGVLWKHPEENTIDSSSSMSLRSVVFRLSHGGEVSSDGNCLFTASHKAMNMAREVDAREIRRRTVRRFLDDFGSARLEEVEVINEAIRHLYSPDLKNGWGIHVVQEVKFLAKKEDRPALDGAIDELVQLGMQRYNQFILTLDLESLFYSHF